MVVRNVMIACVLKAIGKWAVLTRQRVDFLDADELSVFENQFPIFRTVFSANTTDMELNDDKAPLTMT